MRLLQAEPGGLDGGVVALPHKRVQALCRRCSRRPRSRPGQLRMPKAPHRIAAR
jgi:hypothetical protein